jgi:hypothetical protein
MCSALTFPRRKLSQAVFEIFGVLCVTIVLLFGTLRSIPPEAIFSEAEQNTVARGTIAAGLVGTSAAAWDRRLAEEAAPGVDNLANS